MKQDGHGYAAGSGLPKTPISTYLYDDGNARHPGSPAGASGCGCIFQRIDTDYGRYQMGGLQTHIMNSRPPARGDLACQVDPDRVCLQKLLRQYFMII